MAAVRQVFLDADAVIFTLGLTEAWLSKHDGAVFPACPGTIAGHFDPGKHRFRNFTLAEIVDDLSEIHTMLSHIKPNVKLILTVSPVPLVATASPNHVLVASMYSKSVLRAACGEFCSRTSGVMYFPAYEIITGPQAPDDIFEPDRRNVTTKEIDTVMRAFLHCCDAEQHPPAAEPAGAVGATAHQTAELSTLLSNIECEEAGAAL